jgi:hypothetical protein
MGARAGSLFGHFIREPLIKQPSAAMGGFALHLHGCRKNSPQRSWELPVAIFAATVSTENKSAPFRSKNI